MNLIVLSHMYPYEAWPYNGIFVQEQLKAVRKLLDGIIYVISPVPWAPKPLWFRYKWRRYGLADRASSEGGIQVLRPRYPNLPGSRSLHINCYSMYFSVMGALSHALKETGREDTVIHSHDLLPDGLAGAMAARKFGLKSLCTLHGSDINHYPFFSKGAYEHSRRSLAMNDSLVAVSGKIMERALKIFPEARINVIMNGVDLEKFRPVKDRKKEGRQIVFVGRLEEDKGIKELLQAFRQIYRKYRDTSLRLIGEPMLKDWILEFARRNGLDKAVEITGVVKHGDLPEKLGGCSVFVLPSYSEGLPVSMFEAMAMGLPVVVSSVGGVPEVIRHGENGLLIKPQSVDEIVEKISLLLENRALADNIAATGLKEVHAEYSWDVSAKRLVGKYREILDRNRRH